MGEFIGVATGFPAVVLSAALLVVIVFWLLVVAGGADHHTFGTPAHVDAVGLGGVPGTVVASFVIVIGWLGSLTGSVLIGRSGLTGYAHTAAGLAVLLLALLVAWWATRFLVRPLAKLFPDEPGPSRQDFIGSTCVIRTGRVDAAFGQAEVTARDGAVALVQVRQSGADDLNSGSTGLLYAYDDVGEFFWVTPYEAALDPGPHG